MARVFRPILVAAALALILTGTACTASSPSNGTYSNPGAAAPDQFNGATPRPSGAPAEANPAEDPQSTFALDVDTASYSYASAQIGQGRLPAANTVRPEEFINAMPEDYRQPDGNGFGVTVDGARLPTSFHEDSAADTRLLRIGLQTRGADSSSRPDAALTFVIDTSGSMADPGKLDLVKSALHSLVDQLRNTDSAGIVAFNDDATVLQEMAPLSRRADLHRAIDRLNADGSTNLESGLVAGYDVARKGFRTGATNRVVLLSDGLANTGETQTARILAKVREQADKQITLLGVGVGSDYGDAFMESLADHGDGFVVYVSDPTQARRVFIDRLPATSVLRALDAKAQVTFDATTVQSYRLIGYDDRALADSSFRNDHVDGGEVFAGHTVTALYAVRLKEGARGPVATARVRWLDPGTREAHETAQAIRTEDLDGAFTAGSRYLQACYAAGYFAEVLRNSPYAAQVRLPDLADVALAAASGTGRTEIGDLAGLIRRAADLRR